NNFLGASRPPVSRSEYLPFTSRLQECLKSLLPTAQWSGSAHRPLLCPDSCIMADSDTVMGHNSSVKRSPTQCFLSQVSPVACSLYLTLGHSLRSVPELL
ncbi:hypothetical protein J6590_046061, partial [Homalodisca vitripennis]